MSQSAWGESPGRRTQALNGQQKDLVIAHLKSELYELKTADRDYASLRHQSEQVRQRVDMLR